MFRDFDFTAFFKIFKIFLHSTVCAAPPLGLACYSDRFS